MAANAVSSSLTNSVLGTVGSSGKQPLGKDEFLKLLTTQLRYQNPMEPLKDGEFVAQLSQFSTLEGIQQMNTSFAEMLLLQQMTQGANLIGKTIAYEKPDSTVLGRGIVESVTMASGKLQLMVNGKPIALSQVRGIAATR
jgi:flagellar basal-body rod modification protein FlgD